MKLPTAIEIVADRLRVMGADGLCTDGCGCGLDDLQPCGEDFSRCVPARRVDRAQAKEIGLEVDDWDDLNEFYVEMES